MLQNLAKYSMSWARPQERKRAGAHISQFYSDCDESWAPPTADVLARVQEVGWIFDFTFLTYATFWIPTGSGISKITDPDPEFGTFRDNLATPFSNLQVPKRVGQASRA